MTAKKKPERRYKVGDKVRVRLATGKIVDATVLAVTESTHGLRLQVDFGVGQTARIHAWQVVED